MPSAFERQVLLFHIGIETAPKGADIPKMAEVAQMLNSEWKANRAVTRLEELEAEDIDQETLETAKKRPNNAVFISDMQLRPDGCDVLLTLGDAAESDPTIIHLRKRTLNHVSKGKDGGVGFSAHLSLSFKGSAPPVQYRATLERMHNLGRSTVVTYINRILRNYARENKFRFVEATTGRDLAYRPKLKSVSQPSRALKSALKTGRFSEVVLIQRKKVTDELDTKDAYIVKEKRLRVGTENVPATEEGRLNWLNVLTRRAKLKGFDEVYVRMKSLAGGANMTSRFSTEVADAADAVFSRHEDVHFSAETGHCHDKIVSRISDPLAAMLKKDSLWN